MATKPPDKGHDSTMELSVSQLVVPSKRPIPPSKNNPQNDMSLWGGVVVGTQDFAPAPARPTRPKTRWKWIVGALLVVAASLGGYLVVTSLGSSPTASPNIASTPAAAPASKTDAPTAEGSAKPTTHAATGSAAVTTGSSGSPPAGSAAGSATGAAGSATGSAAAAPGTSALVAGEVDAISGVAPIIKPAVKKKKKKPGRKIIKKTPSKKAASKRR